MSYIIKVRAYVDGRRVDGEYDGGKTLSDARKEATWFREHVRVDPMSEVRICRVSREGHLHIVEHFHGS